MSTPYHTPALLAECIAGLKINPKGYYADLTMGSAGHSKEIAKNLTSGKLLAIDQDPQVQNHLPDHPNFYFHAGNFQYLKRFAIYENMLPLDGVLADLGVSFHHFDSTERGFTFRNNSPLDMRMNPQSTTSAASILNEYSLNQLCQLFRLYGELKNAYLIAQKIVNERKLKRIETSDELKEIVSPLSGKAHQEHKFLAKIFQALRMEVNHEMETLERMLEQLPSLLKPGGRIAIISYHSLEDRLVKNFFKSGNFEGSVSQDIYGNTSSPFKLITRKLITPSAEEVALNNRARSAKLRIAELR